MLLCEFSFLHYGVYCLCVGLAMKESVSSSQIIPVFVLPPSSQVSVQPEKPPISPLLIAPVPSLLTNGLINGHLGGVVGSIGGNLRQDDTVQQDEPPSCIMSAMNARMINVPPIRAFVDDIEMDDVSNEVRSVRLTEEDTGLEAETLSKIQRVIQCCVSESGGTAPNIFIVNIDIKK